MQRAFTSTEIEKAVKRLKTGKSAGIDELNSELIKYGPETICEGIAEIYNIMAETGEFPTEVKEGILIPLPKPGKKSGPPRTPQAHNITISTKKDPCYLLAPQKLRKA